MSSSTHDDLRAFHQFVGEKVDHGGVPLSPEDVLEEWRTLHPHGETLTEEVEAIQEAIDDMEHGDPGIPFEDFDREFRARHKLPPRS